MDHTLSLMVFISLFANFVFAKNIFDKETNPELIFRCVDSWV